MTLSGTSLSCCAVLASVRRAGAVARVRPISDFYVAGRLVPALFNGMAIAVSLIPRARLCRACRRVEPGLGRAHRCGAWRRRRLLAVAIFCALFAQVWRLYPAGFLGERFGEAGVRPLAVLAVILCSLPALALTLWAWRDRRAHLRRRCAAPASGLGSLAAAVQLRSAACARRASRRSSNIAVLLAVAGRPLRCCSGSRGGVRAGSARLAQGGARHFAATVRRRDRLNRFALLFCFAAGIASLPHI